MYKNYTFETIIHGVTIPKEDFKIIATQSISEISQFLLWLLYDKEGTHLMRRGISSNSSFGELLGTLKLGETDKTLIMHISCIQHQSSDPTTSPAKSFFNYSNQRLLNCLSETDSISPGIVYSCHRLCSVKTFFSSFGLNFTN